MLNVKLYSRSRKIFAYDLRTTSKRNMFLSSLIHLMHFDRYTQSRGIYAYIFYYVIIALILREPGLHYVDVHRFRLETRVMKRGKRERDAEDFEHSCQIFPLLFHILLTLKFQSSHCVEWPAEKRASKPDSQILYTMFTSIGYMCIAK